MLAPVLLVVLRLIQGFGLGGEWGGAVLIVSEYGDPARRGYWASRPQAGVPLGQLIANGLLALLALVQSEDAFLSWGWRIPSAVGGAGVDRAVHPAVDRGIAGVPRRAGRAEAGASLGEKQRMPIIEVFRQYPREVFTAMGARGSRRMSRSTSSRSWWSPI